MFFMKTWFCIFSMFFFPILLYCNDIHVGSIVEGKKLIPCIYINNKATLKIHNKGIHNKFLSSFERAQYIAETLIELQSKKIDISKIRLRYQNKVYYAFINQRRLYGISPGDMKAENIKSPFLLASRWRSQIKSSLLKSNAITEEKDVNDIKKIFRFTFNADTVFILLFIKLLILFLWNNLKVSKSNKQLEKKVQALESHN